MSHLSQHPPPSHVFLPNNLSSDFHPIASENCFKVALFWSPMGGAGLAAGTLSSLLVATVILVPGYMQTPWIELPAYVTKRRQCLCDNSSLVHSLGSK